MSTISIRNSFLSSYGMPIDGSTYYIHEKNTFKNEIVNKAMTINGVQYEYSDPMRNSMYLINTIKSAYESNIAEGSKLFQFVCDAKDEDTLTVSQMFENVCNGMWTLFSDFVKYFARMPITDEFMDAIARMTSSYVANSYNAFLKLKDEYDAKVGRAARDTQERFENYNRMSREKANAVPKTGTFFADSSYKDIFGTQHVYGSVHLFSNYTAGDAYMDMVSDRVLAESVQQKELAALKDNAMDQINAYIKKTLPAYRKDIYRLVSEKAEDLFHVDAFTYNDLEDRPFVEKNWRDALADIPEEDFRKLQHYFEFYKMSIREGIIEPIYQMIVDEISENGDFDAYDGNLIKMYKFFSGCESFKKDRSFSFFLKNYIISKIDKQYENLDPNKVPYNDNTFEDILEAAEKNQYLEYDEACKIDYYINSLRSKIKERRGS